MGHNLLSKNIKYISIEDKLKVLAALWWGQEVAAGWWAQKRDDQELNCDSNNKYLWQKFQIFDFSGINMFFTLCKTHLSTHK